MLPSPRVIHVDTRGAVILSEESPEVCLTLFPQLLLSHVLPAQTRDSRGIYLPNHIEPISHIAIDVSYSPAVRVVMRPNRVFHFFSIIRLAVPWLRLSTLLARHNRHHHPRSSQAEGVVHPARSPLPVLGHRSSSHHAARHRYHNINEMEP
jgi:hypothetical protein